MCGTGRRFRRPGALDVDILLIGRCTELVSALAGRRGGSSPGKGQRCNPTSRLEKLEIYRTHRTTSGGDRVRGQIRNCKIRPEKLENPDRKRPAERRAETRRRTAERAGDARFGGLAGRRATGACVHHPLRFMYTQRSTPRHPCYYALLASSRPSSALTLRRVQRRDGPPRSRGCPDSWPGARCSPWWRSDAWPSRAP